MLRRSRVVLFFAAGILSVAGLAVWAINGAVHGEPAFYHEDVEREPVLAEKSSDEFLQQAAAAASDVRKPGRWDASFTADQINGWLAVDMARNYPGLLPSTFSDPRVAIRPGDVTLACRYDGPEVNAELTITLDVYLSTSNTVALRVKGAHCGLMPLPLGKVLDAISHMARQLELPLEWRRSGGDPVALISMAALNGHLSAHHRVELDTVELRDGELFVAGRTEHASRDPIVLGTTPPTPLAVASPDMQPPVAVADSRVEPVKSIDSIKPASQTLAAEAPVAEPVPTEPASAEPLPTESVPTQKSSPPEVPATEPSKAVNQDPATAGGTASDDPPAQPTTEGSKDNSQR